MAPPAHSDVDSKRQLLWYQIGTGSTAAILLMIGAIGYLRSGLDPFVTGMAVRCGAVMAVVSLALPQLYRLKSKLPSIAGGFALFALLLIALRPKIANVLLTLLAMGIALQMLTSWLAKFTDQNRDA